MFVVHPIHRIHGRGQPNVHPPAGGLPRLVALLLGGQGEAKEPALLLLLALAQGHEQQEPSGIPVIPGWG